MDKEEKKFRRFKALCVVSAIVLGVTISGALMFNTFKLKTDADETIKTLSTPPISESAFEAVGVIAGEVEADVLDAVIEVAETMNEPLYSISSKAVEATVKNNTQQNQQVTANTTNSGGQKNTFDRYLGRFNIPSAGLSVACYDSASQATVDAWDSAAYFFANGHTTIGDHVNQEFGALSKCYVGAKATLATASNTLSYTCVAIINGHNTEVDLTDANYTPIDNMYPGALVCYTCNGNWHNVKIYFFSPDNGQETHIGSGWTDFGSSEKLEACERGEHIFVTIDNKWKEIYDANDNLKALGYYNVYKCEVCGDKQEKLMYEEEVEAEVTPTPTPTPTPVPTPVLTPEPIPENTPTPVPEIIPEPEPAPEVTPMPEEIPEIEAGIVPEPDVEVGEVGEMEMGEDGDFQ